MADAETEYQRLVEQFADHEGVRPSLMFGSPCRQRPKPVPGAACWNPSGRRVLREWVAVPAEHQQHFLALAKAAAGFVGGENNVEP